ncbi:HET-domain-containing protein, partial [Saccharata proteae CBS 121410]
LYSPLDLNSSEIRLIRILRLEAGPSRINGPPIVHCRLEHQFLSQNPTYEALSYAWGSPKRPRTIFLNDRPIRVTKGLEAALRQFASEIRDAKESPLLWVDALCINQRDDKEKSQQVTQMARIYSNAKQVLIWLGRESDDSSLAMETLDWLHGMYETALESLTGRAWFRRIWVIQEVTLSKIATV